MAALPAFRHVVREHPVVELDTVIDALRLGFRQYLAIGVARQAVGRREAAVKEEFATLCRDPIGVLEVLVDAEADALAVGIAMRIAQDQGWIMGVVIAADAFLRI